ncbi:MAG: sugar ABC transporter permease [Candidatus Acetothermia bacterium]|jgi:ABC-type sugar transport system permease subunit|nr:sugar ABC transporter permease [Candidatus Acetothermia bacterium]MDH7505651.1 sugar ABC transporter permease [Candidatus Acetothermia bacterium]
MRAKIRGFLYRHRGLEGILYVLPFAALWGIFLAWPVGYGIYLSLFEWSPMQGSRFVGLENYIKLFGDARFLNALGNTFKFAAIAVPLILGLGLLFALMLWSWGRTRRGVGFIQAVLFFPYLLTVSTVAITWKWMFDPDFGLVTHAFKALKIAAPVFLTEPAWALPAIAFATAWWLAGYRMVVFQAGLGEIPQELFEVASIDGAVFHQKFLHIILPLLKPALLFSLVLTLISAFRTFGQALMMTEGGPGRSTEVLALYLYRTAFEYFNIGKAAASGVVLLVIMLVLTLIGVKLLGLKSELG